jgi:hemerythrin-like metal-binding protein
VENHYNPYLEEYIMPNAFLWTESHSVGIDLLDDQRKTLMELTDFFVSDCTGATSDTIRSCFSKRVDDILNYFVFHFKMEERFLSVLNFPGASIHRKGYVRSMGEIRYWLNEINPLNPETILSFARYLRERIFYHITEEDQEYGRYILSLKHQESQILHSKYA